MQVQFEVDADRLSQIRRAGLVEDGDHVEATYDSRFGGEQTVAGEVDIRENVLERDDFVVDGRNIDFTRVYSTGRNSRHVGDLISARLTMGLDRAIEAVTLHMDGHDVDDGGAQDPGDEIIVQSWSGRGDDFYGQGDYLEIVG